MMRRQVEEQIEIPERDSLGILALFVMWVLALMALSSAAHGEERQTQKSATITSDREAAVVAQMISETKVESKSVARSRNGGDANQQRVASVEGNNLSAPSTPVQQDDSDGAVKLTRFILISIPDRQLALVNDGQVVKIYSIAVGSTHTPSPEGNFTIVSHVANPTWTHKGKVVQPGKNNPVGSRWMGLSVKGYGIHGTNAPRSIGKAASHGCFRMGKKDVEELFTLVRVGMPAASTRPFSPAR